MATFGNCFTWSQAHYTKDKRRTQRWHAHHAGALIGKLWTVHVVSGSDGRAWHAGRGFVPRRLLIKRRKG